MERGKLGTLVDCLSAVVDKVPAKKKYPDSQYEYRDAINSAFSAFFFQHPSFLNFMHNMQNREKRDNVQSLFAVKGIPCDNQIRTLADEIEPDILNPVFNETLKVAQRSGVIDEYRVLPHGETLMALDGLHYFESYKVQCSHCLTKQVKQKDGTKKTLYFHAAVAGVLVKPGSHKVLPVMAEIISNTDGAKKQDCELNASKRALDKHGKEYQWLKPTLLGDDLYSHRPFCEKVLDAGYSFIFTCKESSHPWLAETLQNSYLHEIHDIKWNANRKQHMCSTWRYLNGVPIRDDAKDPLLVNYLSLEIKTEETGKRIFFNSWITNKNITDLNVAYLAECGRTRWKIENEHNNVLKTRGYHLEHNFGHGDEHACDIFFMLNLLALQFHTILEYCDIEYQETRALYSSRVAYFEALRVLICRRYFTSWSDFLRYVRGTDESPYDTDT
jgi:hypothetical protein